MGNCTTNITPSAKVANSHLFQPVQTCHWWDDEVRDAQCFSSCCPFQYLRKPRAAKPKKLILHIHRKSTLEKRGISIASLANWSGFPKWARSFAFQMNLAPFSRKPDCLGVSFRIKYCHPLLMLFITEQFVHYITYLKYFVILTLGL